MSWEWEYWGNMPGEQTNTAPLFDAATSGLLDALSDGVYTVDSQRRILFWNRAAEAMTGFSRSEMIGQHCFQGRMTHVDESGQGLCGGGCSLLRAITQGQESEAEVFLRHKDGQRIPVRTRVSPLRDPAGAIVGAVQVFVDTSFVAHIKQRIGDTGTLALLDPLTGIPNRRMVESVLKVRRDEFARFGWRYGVLFADIDHFKAINDQYGHATGDRLLKAVAASLTASLRGMDMAGRWGGEEFVGVIANVTPAQFQAACRRVFNVATQAAVLLDEDGPTDGQRTAAGLSVGATLALPGDFPESIVGRADRLMYESKRNGRCRLTFG